MPRLQPGFIKSLKFCHHHRPGSGGGNRGAFSTGILGLLVQVTEGAWVSRAVTPLSEGRGVPWVSAGGPLPNRDRRQPVTTQRAGGRAGSKCLRLSFLASSLGEASLHPGFAPVHSNPLGQALQVLARTNLCSEWTKGHPPPTPTQAVPSSYSLLPPGSLVAPAAPHRSPEQSSDLLRQWERSRRQISVSRGSLKFYLLITPQKGRVQDSP